MDCDHSAPPVYKGGMWVCSRCDIPVKEKTLELDWDGVLGENPPIEPLPKPEGKCTCGAEKMFGKPAPGHYPDCLINDKKK